MGREPSDLSLITPCSVSDHVDVDKRSVCTSTRLVIYLDIWTDLSPICVLVARGNALACLTRPV